MKKITNFPIKILTIFFVSIFVLVNYSVSLAKSDKVETYVQNGMTFVKGEHHPEKRVNSSPSSKTEIHKEIIYIEKEKKPLNNESSNTEKAKENSEEVQQIGNDEEAEEQKINNDDSLKEIQKKDVMTNKNILSIIVGAIRELWERIVGIENNVNEQADNIEGLVETTTTITDEITSQNKRLEKLESKLSKDKNDDKQKINKSTK